eukprot:m.27561 g.27561  ORF g.27561 m.27561 type:complete len:503 (-) comp6446_c0_seq1:60-1568(-)
MRALLIAAVALSISTEQPNPHSQHHSQSTPSSKASKRNEADGTCSAGDAGCTEPHRPGYTDTPAPGAPLNAARALLTQAELVKVTKPLEAGRFAREAATLLVQADAAGGTRQSGLDAWTHTSWDWFRVLTLAARASSVAGNLSDATAALSTAVSVLEASPPRSTSPVDGRPLEMEIIATLMDLSGEQTVGGQHDAALSTLAHVELYRPVGAHARKHFAKVVSLQRGKTLRCANRLPEAEAAYKSALELAREIGEHDTPETRALLAPRMNELVEVLNWQGKRDEAVAMATVAAAAGGWPSASQRPVHRHQPGLRSSPWLELRQFPTAHVLAGLLVEHFTELQAEADALLASGAFRRQTECLHDPSRGGWGYVAVVGDANPDVCTDAIAPLACRWVAAARAHGDIAAEIVRVGYSAVDPTAWIRPHTGVDNTQLKLHLGLRVPKDKQVEHCATFTIGGETRSWPEGGVVIFDDTHEHSVWNNCTEQRVILQVVIRHPDVPRAGS